MFCGNRSDLIRPKAGPSRLCRVGNKFPYEGLALLICSQHQHQAPDPDKAERSEPYSDLSCIGLLLVHIFSSSTFVATTSCLVLIVCFCVFFTANTVTSLSPVLSQSLLMTV